MKKIIQNQLAFITGSHSLSNLGTLVKIISYAGIKTLGGVETRCYKVSVFGTKKVSTITGNFVTEFLAPETCLSASFANLIKESN